MTGRAPRTQTAEYNAADHLIVLVYERQADDTARWHVRIQTGMPFERAERAFDLLATDIPCFLMNYGRSRVQPHPALELDAAGLDDCGSDGVDAA